MRASGGKPELPISCDAQMNTMTTGECVLFAHMSHLSVSFCDKACDGQATGKRKSFHHNILAEIPTLALRVP